MAMISFKIDDSQVRKDLIRYPICRRMSKPMEQAAAYILMQTDMRLSGTIGTRRKMEGFCGFHEGREKGEWFGTIHEFFKTPENSGNP